MKRQDSAGTSTPRIKNYYRDDSGPGSARGRWLLDEVEAHVADGYRTAEIDTRGLNSLDLVVDVDRSTGTAIVVEHEVTIDGGATWAKVTDADGSGASAAAARVLSSAETFDIEHAQTLVAKADGGSNLTATFEGTAASVEGGSETFDLTEGGKTLGIEVDALDKQTITFPAAAPIATTSEEEPFDLSTNATLSVSVDGGAAEEDTFEGAAATVTSTTAGLYNFATSGLTLDTTTDADARQFTFVAAAPITNSFVNHPFDFSSNTTVGVNIDSDGWQDHAIGAVAATITSGNAETFDLSSDDDLAIKIDDEATAQDFTIAASYAVVKCAVEEPYDLSSSLVRQLAITVDGVAEQTHSITDLDAVDISAATAFEIATWINSEFTDVAASDSDGYVQIIADNVRGTDSSLTIAGTLASAIELPSSASGSGDAADITAVTAAEVVACINASLTGGVASEGTGGDAGKVVVTSDTRGTDSAVQVTGGAAGATELNFSAVKQDGSGDVADITAVTATELVTWLNAEFTDFTASVFQTDKVRIASDGIVGTGGTIGFREAAPAIWGLSASGTGFCSDLSSVSAAEIAAFLNTVLDPAVKFVASVDSEKVKLTTISKGSGSSVQVTGGTANALLNFTTDAQFGSGDAADITAVTAIELAAWLHAFTGMTAAVHDTTKVRVTSAGTIGSDGVLAFDGNMRTEVGLPNAATGSGFCGDITAVTAAEVVDQINATLTNAVASATGAGSDTLTITSDKVGSASRMKTPDGTGRIALGFDTGQTSGTGFAADITVATAAEVAAVVNAVGGLTSSASNGIVTISGGTAGPSGTLRILEGDVQDELDLPLAVISGSPAMTRKILPAFAVPISADAIVTHKISCLGADKVKVKVSVPNGTDDKISLSVTGTYGS